jgi:hypothetical protein
MPEGPTVFEQQGSDGTVVLERTDIQVELA